ncbi:MAG: FAD-dependent monooxygenase, partial [Granulosicoccus sp.]|nr:FAD-dependent monooxygenase [Granulosicoccus sp.]
MPAQRYETVFDLYPYKRVAEQSGTSAVRHTVVIVGGGPVGLSLALDLGRKNIPVLLVDDHPGVGLGSKAICFAKRTLDICNRLGCANTMLDKGVVWNLGRVYYRSKEVFSFNLSPEGGQKNPAFINLQQPYFEKYLHDQIQAEQRLGKPIEIRGCNKLIELDVRIDHSLIKLETPDGNYTLEADWLIACDGARSTIRQQLDLDFEGRVFEDNFLIADVRMTAPFPSERWFWFEPPFEGAGQSALLHKQPDDIWRIDFQLGWDIDRQSELQTDKVRARVDAMLGDDVAYELVWTSIYTFQCRRMRSFSHGRVLFAGDSAHQVSPFGARGANSGVQDADNLAWKLALVINGLAPERLIKTYAEERECAADENILNSTRATDFLTPKSPISSVFRNAVLHLAEQFEFARPLVNSGRLSVPFAYDNLSLTGDDHLQDPAISRAGAACPDAPVGDGFLLDQLGDT